MTGPVVIYLPASSKSRSKVPNSRPLLTEVTGPVPQVRNLRDPPRTRFSRVSLSRLLSQQCQHSMYGRARDLCTHLPQLSDDHDPPRWSGYIKGVWTLVRRGIHRPAKACARDLGPWTLEARLRRARSPARRGLRSRPGTAEMAVLPA